MIMRIRTMGRHLREGIKNVGRNGGMTFASVSAVSITLLILGVFLLLAMNVNHIADQVKEKVEIRVFLEEAVNPSEVEYVKQEIQSIPKVASVDFVPKEAGLEELKDSFGEKAYLFKGLEQENPLPDAFVVRAVQPENTGEVAKQINRIRYVDELNYGKETVEKLFSVTKVVHNIGIAFIVGLAFTAMFLISNTIKLTIVARSKEIEIMKLVGATNGFIRWPFFIEGLLMGVLGSLLPIGLLAGGYSYLLNNVMIDFLFQGLLPLFPLVYQISLTLLGIGIFIGIWGSMVSVRRFLKV